MKIEKIKKCRFVITVHVLNIAKMFYNVYNDKLSFEQILRFFRALQTSCES